MPSNLRQNTPEVLVNEEDINPDADIQPTILDDNINSAQISPIRNLDYTQASLEDLLREVDLLELPEFEIPLDIRQRIPVEPIPEIKVESKKPTENLLIPEVVTTPLLDPEPVAPVAMDIEEYTVLGEQIDQELREKSGSHYADQACFRWIKQSICYPYGFQSHCLLQQNPWSA